VAGTVLASVIEVRPLAAGDAPAVHSLLGDPAVAVWLRPVGISQPFTLDECETFVRAQMGHWTAHGFGCSLAWHGAQCVAWSLQHCIVAGASEVEIGWTVASARWGEGIATRMGQHALARAASLRLDTVIAYARVDNAGSLRVIEKLGLVYEREFEHAGRPHVVYRTAVGAHI
jgi:RimJ/RimL family protein N-acetyltransferase